MNIQQRLPLFLSGLFLFFGLFFSVDSVFAKTITCSGQNISQVVGVPAADEFNDGDDLILNGSGTCTLTTAATLNSLTIGDEETNPATVLTHVAEDEGGVNVTTVTFLTIHSGASIDVSERGCGAAESPNTDTGVCGSEGGGGNEAAYRSGGGAYGGDGGDTNGGGSGGAAYGDEADASLLGAGGGDSLGIFVAGGLGGGLVSLSVGTILTIDGDIIANGGDGSSSGSGNSGAGSGGGINIDTATFAGSGSFSATGGDSTYGGGYYGGSGGGGRVAIYYISASGDAFDDLSPSVTTAHGSAANASYDGDDGSVYFFQYAVPSAPSITFLTDESYNIEATPSFTSSGFFSNGKIHETTSWSVLDSDDNEVWRSYADASNLTSVDLSSDGTFVGTLSGSSSLASYTDYKVRVLHTNIIGDSSWSTSVNFRTEFVGLSDSHTWEFNESTPAEITAAFDFDDTKIEIDTLAGESNAQLINSSGSYPTASLNGYTRFVPVTIANSGADISDIQVELSVSYDTDMNSDFSDLRFFVDSGATEAIDYWIQEYVTSTSATVWIELSELVSGDNTIYMFYGNSSAVDMSSIDDVFIFADDFSDVSLDTSKWPTNSGASVSGGELTLNGSDYIHATTTNIGTDVVFEARQKSANNQASRFGLNTAITDFFGGGADYLGFQYFNNANKYTDSAILGGGYNQDQIGLYSSDTYYINTVERISTTSALFYEDDVLLETYTTNLPTNTELHPLFRNDIVVDWIYVRKYTPNSISVSYGDEANAGDYGDVAISVALSGSHPTYDRLLSFSVELGDDNAGDLYFQLSNDGNTWYYHDGDSWTEVLDDNLNNNSGDEVNTFIPAFVDDVGVGDIYVRSFLISSGSDPVEIDAITVAYDAGDPAGLANFSYDSNDATDVVLSWDAATDGAFSHYEVWYGENSTEVSSKSGGALEYDNGDDVTLATASTGSVSISGLTYGATYYAKIWAYDVFGNFATTGSASFSPTIPSGATISAQSGASYARSSTIALDLLANDATEMYISGDVDGEESWIAYMTSRNVALSSGDGEKTVSVKFRDGSLNETSDVTDTIIVDSVSPSSSVSRSAGSYDDSVTVELSCIDTLSGCDAIYVTTDGTTPTTSSLTYGGPLTFNEDTTLRFFALDSAGNEESVQTVSYIIETDDLRDDGGDIDTPEISEVSPELGATKISKDTSIGFNLVDPSGVDLNTLVVEVRGERSGIQSEVVIAFSGSSTNYRIILIPSNDFLLNERVTLDVTVSDLLGNELQYRDHVFVIKPASEVLDTSDVTQINDEFTVESPVISKTGADLESQNSSRIFDAGVDMAVGDLTFDGTKEIISSPLKGLSYVYIYSKEGYLLTPPFMAYPSYYQKGVHVEVADLEGTQGEQEIIVSPVDAPGHIRIFNKEGEELGSFFSRDDGFVGETVVKPVNLEGSDSFSGELELVVLSSDGLLQVFNKQGKELMPAKKVFLPERQGGENIFFDLEVVDIENNGGAKEIIVADHESIMIYGKDNESRLKQIVKDIIPYEIGHQNYGKGIEFAIGDLDNGFGEREIIVSSQTGGSEIRVFNKDGVQLLPGFHAYGSDYKGGVDVVVEDLHGSDGPCEIITMSKKHSVHVRMFNKEGQPLSGGFVARDEYLDSSLSVSNLDAQEDQGAVSQRTVVVSPKSSTSQLFFYSKDSQKLNPGWYATRVWGE